MNLRGTGAYAGVSDHGVKHLHCDVAEGHIAANQIFPLIQNEQFRTPTVKHHCPKVALASVLRACSNKVYYEEKMFEKFRIYFHAIFIPKFLKHLEHQLVEVDVHRWLKKFPLAMRSKMEEALKPENASRQISMLYEAFTKVEMQFTTVEHDLKDTPLNDTKERKISGPQDEKKVHVNAFIWYLEEVASNYMEEYCGRANWIQICGSLDKASAKFGTLLWGASDGSGFDMTQFKACNELMNALIMACARHPNVTIQDPLSISVIEKCLIGSLKLYESFDHGQLRYEAEGRASGDGWTTFGNTILMISYWSFTFHMAGITDYVLKVKGDDVLFAIQPRDKDALDAAVKDVFTNRKDAHKHGLGQICKKLTYGELTDLDFLSNEFFLTSEGTFRMTRIPARVLQTLSWTTKLPSNITKPSKDREARESLCYAKGECLRAWADGLPIFGALANKMIELGRPGKFSDFNLYSDADRVWHQGRDDYDAYLQYLENTYGVTREDVKSVERKISQITDLTGKIDLPELEKFYFRQI